MHGLSELFINKKDVGMASGCDQVLKNNLFGNHELLIEKDKIERYIIINDFDNQKTKHLEKLATKMLKDQDKLDQLKSKNINTDFLNLF